MGISAIYRPVKTFPYNELIDLYNEKFRGNGAIQPTIKNFVSAEMFYERELAEYLYTQVLIGISQSKSNSASGKIDFLFYGSGINVNWYPVKMIKNLKHSVMNPLYFRFSVGAEYVSSTTNITHDSIVINKKLKVVSPFFSTGFGYDLHFGKRIVTQPFFGLQHYFTPLSDDFELLLTNQSDSRLPLKESSFQFKISLSLLVLF